MLVAPDEVLGDGRYQLLARCGVDESAGMEFWHAWDMLHDTNVALTVLPGDPADLADVAAVRHVLEGVRFAETVTAPALARVIDLPGPGHVAASHDGVLGLVAAEWTDGVNLPDVVLDGPLDVGVACRVLRPLVAAVDAAHHLGVAVGVDAPYRVRIGAQGTAVLAFRGTRQDATPRDDVRGLGAVLYLLLTGMWPDLSGELVAPADLRFDVPRDLSLIAVLSVDDRRIPDIRTCGPLLRALDEVIARENEITAEMPLLLTPVLAPPEPAPHTPPPPPPAPVAPTGVSEYLVSGSEDNPARLGRVMDGDPGTVWQTDIYRQQFPAFIPGIGIMAGLPRPLPLASVTIWSPSAGTVVEIHAATSPGQPLSSAPLLGTATLQSGATTIPLHAAAPTPYVLVWITQLSADAGGYRSAIGEISCQPAQ